MQHPPPPLAVWLTTLVILALVAACAVGLKAVGVDILAMLA